MKEFIADTSKKEWKPLIDLAISYIKFTKEKNSDKNNNFRNGYIRKIYETFSIIPVITLKEILNNKVFQMHGMNLDVITAIAYIPEEDRKSVVKLTEIYNKLGDIITIINCLLTIPSEDRFSIVSYSLELLPKNTEDYTYGMIKFHDPSHILKSIGNIPLKQRHGIVSAVSPFIKNERDLLEISRIIDIVYKLKSENCTSVINSSSLLLSKINDPTLENIEHIINNIIKLPKAKRIIFDIKINRS